MIRLFAAPLVAVGLLTVGGIATASSAMAQARPVQPQPPARAQQPQAQPQQPSAIGLWEHREDGQPSGWFRVTEKDGVYEGQIVKMFPKNGEDPTTFRCTKCEDERKDQLVLGITLIKDMQRKSALEYEDGNVLDPRNGSVYRAKMTVSPDGKQLTMRGFLGISLFGQSQVWTRLPDNALAIEGGPGIAYTPPPAPAAAPPTRKTQNRTGTTTTGTATPTR